MNYLDFGIFIPIANNGWIMSKASQYMPTFDLNKEITLKAEQYGFDFAFSMVKWRGYGGEIEHWDYALESFNLMAGLAAVTSTIDLYASIAIPTVHPAVVARMAVTIDDISNGRFGINIVSGWNKLEYSQMGILADDSYLSYRYEYATEYVEILKRLWAEGRVTYKGKFFELTDCLCQPKPSRDIPIVCAGQSDRGIQFTAELGHYNFVLGELETVSDINLRLKQKASDCKRQVGTYALFTVVAAPTDAAAQARVQALAENADMTAIQAWGGALATDKGGGMSTAMQAEMFMGIPTIVGSYATVAAKLDQLATKTTIDGVLFTFPNFVDDITNFGEAVIPLLQCRQQTKRAIAA
ncbi:LLM class flavin-dependent oxidoreductase [Stenomitos frigidus]|uniref:Pyrimidine utilization protein A n=1 Tax=Stenomitos frigidus ULC18 TaxID=2107698 RepID=A0A2T1EBG9_9CYAN|nr:LLM class flavin-dependent oxidoreductase [Stenomitos frigidus]PSB30035.1 pyrimidine utilization protein A [Stenomitos frigidus ULC18]